MFFKIIKFILKMLLSSNCTRFQLSVLFISYENCRATNVTLLADKWLPLSNFSKLHIVILLVNGDYFKVTLDRSADIKFFCSLLFMFLAKNCKQIISLNKRIIDCSSPSAAKNPDLINWIFIAPLLWGERAANESSSRGLINLGGNDKTYG